MNLKNNHFYYGLSDTLRKDLEQKYKIEALDIEDVFTSTQLSKVEQRANYIYVALHFPDFWKEKRHFLTKEVHCFVAQEYFLIIDKHNFKYIPIFEEKKDEIKQESDSNFEVFYEMLDFLVTRLFGVIGKFKLEINEIESHLFDFEKSQDDLKEILIIKRNLINFSSLISPLTTVVIELETKYHKFVDKFGMEKLDDTLDKLKKINNNLQNFKEQMELLNQTNESLINRSSNKILKVLTAISLIMVPPTFIASFFGMNVYLGWYTQTETYLPVLVIIALIATASILLYWIFKKNRVL